MVRDRWPAALEPPSLRLGQLGREHRPPLHGVRPRRSQTTCAPFRIVFRSRLAGAPCSRALLTPGHFRFHPAREGWGLAHHPRGPVSPALPPDPPHPTRLPALRYAQPPNWAVSGLLRALPPHASELGRLGLQSGTSGEPEVASEARDSPGLPSNRCLAGPCAPAIRAHAVWVQMRGSGRGQKRGPGRRGSRGRAASGSQPGARLSAEGAGFKGER